MLILTRKLNERLIINGNITIEFLGFRNGQCRLGIRAPREVTVDREEIYLRKEAEKSGQDPTE